jgi:hypothetical protein
MPEIQIALKKQQISDASRSIRTSIFIDRSNSILEKAFFYLSGIPKNKHPEFIRSIIFNHITNGKSSFSLPDSAPDSIESNYSGFSVVVAFSPKEMGFGDIHQRLSQTSNNEHRRSIASKAFFGALLSLSGISKTNGDLQNETSTAEQPSATPSLKKVPPKLF